jgi:uncharacterized protein (UPF0305 family)
MILKCQALQIMMLLTGMAQNGINMAMDREHKRGDVTPEYVNRKMESMMSALFDTIEDFENRTKVLEQQVHELKKRERDGTV